MLTYIIDTMGWSMWWQQLKDSFFYHTHTSLFSRPPSLCVLIMCITCSSVMVWIWHNYNVCLFIKCFIVSTKAQVYQSFYFTKSLDEERKKKVNIIQLSLTYWYNPSSLNVQDSSILPTQTVSSDLTCQWPQTTHPLCSVVSMTTDEARTNTWAHSDQTLKVHFLSAITFQSERFNSVRQLPRIHSSPY